MDMLAVWTEAVKIHSRLSFIKARVHPCECTGPDCDNTPTIPILENQWNQCPYPLLRSLAFEKALYYFAAREVSPLSNWPGGYAASTSHILQALHMEREERKLKEHKRLSRGIK